MKLFVYGYIHKIRSSRALEKACKVNVEVQWLMGKLTPDHWTIANFRRENEEKIKDIIKRFTKFLIDTGYAEGKEIVIDGTKLKANASVDSVTTIEELKERIIDTEKKIVYYLESINEEDEKEEELEQLRKEKEEELERLRKEKEELRKRLEEAEK
jgi:chromosome segregation ATPase